MKKINEFNKDKKKNEIQFHHPTFYSSEAGNPSISFLGLHSPETVHTVSIDMR